MFWYYNSSWSQEDNWKTEWECITFWKYHENKNGISIQIPLYIKLNMINNLLIIENSPSNICPLIMLWDHKISSIIIYARHIVIFIFYISWIDRRKEASCPRNILLFIMKQFLLFIYMTWIDTCTISVWWGWFWFQTVYYANKLSHEKL